MNIVFLSPAFPPNYYNFCAALKKNGHTVLTVGEDPWSSLCPEIRENSDWYYQASNLHDYEELKRACEFFISKFGPIDRVESLNEYWLETEARLRTDFNIAGIKYKDVFRIRRKSEMKKVFASIGLRHAGGMLVPDLAAARAAESKYGFPLVIKPDGGMGAAQTYKLSQPRDTENFFSAKPARDFIIEEFVSGDIQTFDGITDRNGELVFCTSHIYGEGVMESSLSGRHIHYYSLRKIPQDIQETGEKLIKAFDLRERFFHFEFFRKKDGALYALEVNIRPPGGYTTDMFNYACDIDVYDLWAKILAQGTVDFRYERKYHVCFASRRDNIHYAHSPEQIEANFDYMIAMRCRMPDVFSGAMGNYAYILRSPQLEEVVQALDFIHKLA